MKQLEKALRAANFDVTISKVLGKGEAQILGYRGKFDFGITFERGKTMDISISDGNGWSKHLGRLKKIGNEYMGCEPFCQYDARTLQVKEFRHYLHWNLTDDKEELLRHLANGTGGFSRAESKNVVVFDGRTLEDFVDPATKALHQKETELHKKHAGIYGEDPGFCDVDRIERASGLGLYLELCCVTSKKLDSIKENSKTSMISAQSEAEIANYARTATAYHLQRYNIMCDYVTCQICKRFGIKFGTPNAIARLNVIETKKFEKWCLFYGNYLNENYSDKELSQLVDDYLSGKDISIHEPSGSWQD